MSDDEIRIAIAEVCGVLESPKCKPSIEQLEAILADKRALKIELKPDGSICAVPDYVNDLNAMHEAEKNLAIGQHAKYESHIQNILIKEELKWVSGKKNKVVSSERYIWHATARQRAEAFLRTIDKWKESAE